MRFWPVLASLALATAAVPRLARADINGGKVVATVKLPKMLQDGGSTALDKYDAAVPEYTTQYFNQARCQCDVENGVAQHVLLELGWSPSPTGTLNQQLYAWSGTGCPTLPFNDRMRQCQLLTQISADDLATTRRVFERVGSLVSPTDTMCDVGNVTSTYTLSTSTDGGTTLAQELEVKFVADMEPPEVPTTITVDALEDSIRLSWDQLGGTDTKVFQALCSYTDGTAAHVSPTNTAQFITTQRVCMVPPPAPPAATIANSDFAGDPGTPPATLLALDGAFVCGEAPGTATSIDLKKLTNFTPYYVVLVAVDAAGNYSGVHIPSTIEPSPVTDLWEDLNQQNGELEGGFCLVESTFGGGGGGLYGALRAWRDELVSTAAGRWLVERYYAWGAPIAAAARESVVVRIVAAIVLLPLIAIALAWHLLSLPGLLGLIVAIVLWRRRRRSPTRPPKLGLALAAAIVLAPALASAQSVTPYWDDAEAESEFRVPIPAWHLGVRLGPYWPSIDDKFNTSPGPYERMFDQGKGLMPMIGLHRLVTTRFGQFGVGVSGGYFGRDAPSYLDNAMTTDPMDRPRSIANRTYFRLVPLELTGIYRASQIDDDWGIPLVPYLRGGLGYYVWWMRQPDGDISEVCPTSPDGEMLGGDCDRARGASMGLVGAAGLSIRAERIDPDAARSMRDTGLEHAGFFAEVSTAWVDGFGSAKKLSLGDTTWSAGIDFEF